MDAQHDTADFEPKGGGSMTYQCSMCKESQDGEPVFVNGAGQFCSNCKSEIHRRAGDAMRKRRSDLCRWCECVLTPENSNQSPSRDIGVCKECCSRRDWLLKCIRLSDRPARYVARTEEREKQERDARIAARSANLQPTSRQNGDSSRLDRLELMIDRQGGIMEKLIQALGGIE